MNLQTSVADSAPATPDSAFELLVDELGAVAGRIERDTGLRLAAMIAEMQRRDAERELRIERLERELRDRLASLKDGRDGTPGPAGPSGEAGPAGRDGADGASGADGAAGADGKSVSIDDIRPLLLDLVTSAMRTVRVPKDGDPGPKGDKGDAGPKGDKGDQGPTGQAGKPGEKGFDGADGNPGPAGDRGEPGAAGPQGPPGKLPLAKEWTEGGIAYMSDVMTYRGATWQALRDTAKTPGEHVDWLCLSAAGRDGRDFVIRDTYDPDGKYQALDIVTLNSCWFIAKTDNPGACPGPGWKAGPVGKRGAPGERGAKGDKGDPGEKGTPGQTPKVREIVGWELDRRHYSATPIMSDDTRGAALSIRALFEQFQEES
jgi:Collagen triple helix repeat (20 copies)